MIDFSPVYWYWLAALLVGFLPLELFAAISKREYVRGGTFSEFVWWAFGVKKRAHRVSSICPPVRPGDYGLIIVPVRFAPARRIILGGFCTALSLHFVFGASVIPIIAFAPFVAAVLIRAVGWERNGPE